MDERCDWTEDADGIWSACDHNKYTFVEGSPADNEFVYCPYCGKKIAQCSYVEDDPLDE